MLQHPGAVRGLHLNLPNCARLTLHSTERIFFSPNCQSPCDCLAGRGQLNPIEYVFESDEVKYLGVYIDSISSKNKNVSCRISQAVTASKPLKPLFGHRSLPPTWKLTVYCSVIQSILLYAMENATAQSVSTYTNQPRLHRAESTMTEALSRHEHIQSDEAPVHSDIRHSFFQVPTLSQVKTSHTTHSLIGMENLNHYRTLRPIALTETPTGKAGS